MVALKCELCGSPDLVKQDGLFVCQHCGAKYTPDEAKELIGTVKIDRSDEKANLLVLARRARENVQTDSAEKYYERILQLDPYYWEAVFFQAYYQVLNCPGFWKVDDCAAALAGSTTEVLHLIGEQTEGDEQQDALVNVIVRVGNVAQSLGDLAVSGFSSNAGNRGGASAQLDQALASCYALYETAEARLKELFPDQTKLLLTVWKQANEFLACHSSVNNMRKFRKERTRITAAIRAREPDYRPPKAQVAGAACYMATAVYGSYDCPQVWTLRRWRDGTLSKTAPGRAFIRAYYAVSPALVRRFGASAWFRGLCRPPLDRLVERLRRRGLADTPYEDKT